MKKTKVEFSPVVRADVKFYGPPPHLCVDVRFRSRAEIDRLIRELTRLRDTKGRQFDHVHLQDTRLRPGSSLEETEVNFYRPRRRRTPLDSDCVKAAKLALAILNTSANRGPLSVRRKS